MNKTQRQRLIGDFVVQNVGEHPNDIVRVTMQRSGVTTRLYREGRRGRVRALTRCVEWRRTATRRAIGPRRTGSGSGFLRPSPLCCDARC